MKTICRDGIEGRRGGVGFGHKQKNCHWIDLGVPEGGEDDCMHACI